MKSLSCLLVSSLVAAAAWAGSGTSDLRLPSVPGTYGDARSSLEVLVVRDYLPWGGDVVPRFTDRGVNVTVIPTGQLATYDLSTFCMVFVSGALTADNYPDGTPDSTKAHLNSLATRNHLSAYVGGGGALLYVTGTNGATLRLPGGPMSINMVYGENLFTGLNPLASGMSEFPLIHGGEASHDYLAGVPAAGMVYLRNPDLQPTAVDYPIGDGRVLAMTQPLEYYLGEGAGTFPDMSLLLDNAITYMLSAGGCDGQTSLGQLDLDITAIDAFGCDGLVYSPLSGDVLLTITNVGGSVCQGIEALLLPGDGLATLSAPVVTVGDLAPGQSAQALFQLAPNGDACGGFLHYDFSVSCATCPAEAGSGQIQVPCCGVVDAVDLPHAFRLSDAQPNPFNPSATLVFSLPETGHARLDVFNLTGTRVATLVDGVLDSGEHRVLFDGANLSSGLYLARLESAGQVTVSRALLVK